jgi:hypothetical protein
MRASLPGMITLKKGFVKGYFADFVLKFAGK